MRISARIENQQGTHRVSLQTNEKSHSIDIPPKENGLGSSANGGELLFLALATCFCNDIYREAAKRQIQVRRVDVEVEGEFGAEGAPARNVIYRATVAASATAEEIRDLMRYTDSVAEVQNTLRALTEVRLVGVDAVPV